MKVILLKDVPKIGRRYEIKDVSDGYARNFLLKNGVGEIATPQIIQKIESEKQKMNADRIRREKEVNERLVEISRETLIIKAKANEDGHLFAGIKKEEVLKLIQNKGANIKEDELEMNKPIKEIGIHDLIVKISGKSSKIKLNINPTN
jgi:large subunit ribosomal protein L9